MNKSTKKIPDDMVRLIRKLAKILSMKQVAAETGIHYRTVRSILLGRTRVSVK